MKESITKFDLEAAFKALDEIEIPAVNEGIKANRPALTEIFSNKSKLDTLIEEYYDVGSTEELTDAKEAREAEVAKAKLARIEKIVDLDAESPEDLLTSYVGKLIIQCPQCMTLFYKNPEDVEESADDPTTVNVNEVCQHCGNDSGYTLIGKVGEATPEETAELTGESTDEEEQTEELPTDETGEGTDEEEQTDEETTSETEGDDDLADLDELALELSGEEEEPEEEETGKNEDLEIPLAELTPLTEDVDLETSPEDFEKLIKSSELQKPMSDIAARKMMSEFSEAKEDSQDKDKLEECDTEESLTEAGLGSLFKAVGNSLKKTNKNEAEAKAAKVIDRITKEKKTREQKADWILATACDDYSGAKLDNKGNITVNDAARKFKVFVIIGFRDKYSSGKLITLAPSLENKDLIFGMEKPIVKKDYTSAANYAKGWSQKQGNGPAFIYMAKEVNDKKSAVLCEYFNGALENDQLEDYFEKVKKDIESAILMDFDKNSNSEETTEDEELGDAKEIKASEVKKGMKISVGNNNKAEVLEISNSNFGDNTLAIKVRSADNSDSTIIVRADATINVFNTTVESFEVPENFTALIENLDDLQETSLEEAISNSLITAFNEVAGFKLADCEYLNEALTVTGRLYLTSGKTVKTSYTFTEAFTSNDKVKLYGNIENKAELNKYFALTGKIDTANKTFITESFSY